MWLGGGGMLRCAKLMPSTWNGRDYVLHNVFNFAHASLMNCWKAASPERSREALPCCSGQ